MCNKCNAFESLRNHPLAPRSVEELSFRKLVPDAKKGWGPLVYWTRELPVPSAEVSRSVVNSHQDIPTHLPFSISPGDNPLILFSPPKAFCRGLQRKRQRTESSSGFQMLSRLPPGQNFSGVHHLLFHQENVLNTESSQSGIQGLNPQHIIRFHWQ